MGKMPSQLGETSERAQRRAEVRLPSRDPRESLSLLRELATDPMNMHELRAALREHCAGIDVGRLHDHEVVRLCASRMLGAGVILSRIPLSPAPVNAAFTDVGDEAEQAVDTLPDEVEQELTYIEIELLDDDENPIPNVAYRIMLPNQRTRMGNLDEEGRVRLEDIPPGTCTVRFPGLTE